ncbi:ParB/RepB/Spo0J family partition protein [Halobacillus litoralis]|uniref:ParB/RepB/Spo0J family partition protein n=1 Tax=Halobacillus litoralis TaxID=45668 RepID=UPI001CD70346|nr:ParB/RepB/Spo0J family partition protein [Halobacillus litoralis]MCA1020500.1 ParB/RepB/Spo0J family partition protein [Halobacillus litoralis]
MVRGLGRGLDSLITGSMEDDELIDVSVGECRPNPYQPRRQFDKEALEGLQQSIETHGILQPLIVRKSIKGYEVIAGERRLRAARQAALETIPVIVKNLTDEEMMELALLENLQREDLSPVEEARSYEKLIKELNVTQEILSRRLGKSRSHIANLIRLLSLPQEVIELIESGSLSMGHGRALLGLKDRDEQIHLAGRIVKESLNVRQVERLIHEKNQKRSKDKKQPKQADVFLKERETDLRNRLGTAVKIQKGRRKGKIEIEFTNEADLERILNMFQE